MPKIRRSRCVYVAVITALIYVIILCIMSYEGATKQLLSAKFKHLSLDFSGLRHLFKVEDSYSLDKWANAILQHKITQNPGDSGVLMAKYSMEDTPDDLHTIKLPSFLRGEGENPHLAPHDPRFTLGILLSDLNAKIKADKLKNEGFGSQLDESEKSKKSVELFRRENAGDTPEPKEPPDSAESAKTAKTANAAKTANPHRNLLELPTFHWADWTDLAVLDRRMLSIKDSQAKCDLLSPRPLESNNMQKDIALDVQKFCFNDEDLMAMLAKRAKDPKMAPYIQKIASQPYKSGFHVFECPRRTSSRIRKLVAASYLHDFMPAPLAVHLILPNESNGPHKSTTVHIPVNQNIEERIRLVDSPMASAAAKRGKALDLKSEVASLARNLSPDSDPKLNYKKTIEHDSFVEKSAQIASELANSEDRSVQESKYLESLQQSLSTINPSKYFNEALLVRNERNWASGGHYDWRFFKGVKAEPNEHLSLLHGLISAWLRFTNANEITTWIAHGSLLGWYWNGLSFPWDADYDVQVPISDLHTLARHFNQTIVVDFGASETGEIRLGRYFLDCGTWISHRGLGNGLNKIDARFIDLDSGLYIDITGLAVSATYAPARYKNQIPQSLSRPPLQSGTTPDPELEYKRNNAGRLYNCRNKHFSSLPEISPLRLTLMEGVPAYIPNNFTQMLQTEYKAKGIDSKTFSSFAFLPRLRLWANSRVVNKYVKDRQVQGNQIDMGKDEAIAVGIVDSLSVFSFSDQDYLELMSAEQNLLFEYLVTKDATVFHQREMDLLLQGKSTEHLLFGSDGSRPPERQLRHDMSHYNSVKGGKGFTEKMGEYMEMIKAYNAGEEHTLEREKEPASFSLFRPPLRFQAPEERNNLQRTRPDAEKSALEA